jgi:ketosteroid isomerase-like protein
MMEEQIKHSENPEWVNFELGEDVRDERRLEQDRQWAQAVADGRVHLSHREFAVLYGPRFTVAIEDYYLIKLLVLGMYSRKSILRKIEVEILTIIIEYALPGQATLVRSIVQNMETEKTLNYLLGNVKNDASDAFRICVRKRPLLAFERAQGAYEVTHVSGDHSILLHEGRLARNGRLLSMNHHQFAVDNVYDEKTSNEELCRQVVEPLLSWVERGNNATLLCFGQTGTG